MELENWGGPSEEAKGKEEEKGLKNNYTVL